MKNKSSALRAILEPVYTAESHEEGIAIVRAFLEDPGCVIRANEKRVMLIRANQCKDLPKLQMYLTNSFLRYEGMAV